MCSLHAWRKSNLLPGLLPLGAEHWMGPAPSGIGMSILDDVQPNSIGEPRRHQTTVAPRRLRRALEAQKGRCSALGHCGKVLQHLDGIEIAELGEISLAKLLGIERSKPGSGRKRAVHAVALLSSRRTAGNANPLIGFGELRGPGCRHWYDPV